MTSYAWLSIVSLLGSLVLVGAGLRSRNLGARKSLLMAAAWVAIFFVAAAIAAAVAR